MTKSEAFRNLLQSQELLDEIEDMKKELGDVLWYISALARDLDIDLDTIAQLNLQKLKDRQERNKIQGSGDDR